MVIAEVTLELRRTGDKAALHVQGRPYGLAINMTRTDLEHLALYLAHEVGVWRDEQLEAEGSLPQSEQKTL